MSSKIQYPFHFMSDLGAEAFGAEAELQLLLEIDVWCQLAVTNHTLMMEQLFLKMISATEQLAK